MKDEDNITSFWKQAFNLTYKGKKSQSFLNIYRQIYGKDYPEEADHDSFVTKTDLKNIVKYLNVGPGETFIDLGCGRGGPGLWIARENNANYVGIDFSEVGVELAAQRFKAIGLERKAQFHVGNICATDFPDNFFDGAVSIDVLSFIPNQSKAILEVARILRTNAIFVFTSWEKKESNIVNDYRPLLSESGFKVNIYYEAPDWERRQREVYQKYIELKDILIKDMGRAGAAPWIMEAKSIPPILKNRRRIFAVAEKI